MKLFKIQKIIIMDGQLDACFLLKQNTEEKNMPEFQNE
jgi:hypothetical protein